jgi:UDP-glucose 4-epimerase
MNILVTGGAGFIGSHIVEHFQGTATLRVLDNLRSGHRKNLAGLDCEFLEHSILDRVAVRQAMAGVDYVFHLAAMVSVPESMQKPVECNEINTTGTLIILEEAARAGVKKLVFSSSAAIYGANPTVPKIETMLPEPRSPYAITKLDGEHYCNLFTLEGRLPTACLRYFNVFGPRQDPRSQYAAAVPLFVERVLRHEPLTIFGNGEQTRDFIFVKDVVAANAYFATQTQATGVFNVACGKRISVNDLATTLCQILNSPANVRHEPERPGDVKHSLASVDKLHAAGFSAASDFHHSLRATVDFFKTR